MDDSRAEVALPARRIGGDRYVRGEVRFTDDIWPAGLLHAAFVRSTSPHARLLSIQTERARAMPGVRLLLTGQDSRGLIGPLESAIPAALTGTDGPLKVACLAEEYVRYWGEPIAIVVADTFQGAREAAAAVVVEYDEIEPLLTAMEATKEGARQQHPELPGNVVFSGVVSGGNVEAGVERSAHTVSGSVSMGRSSALPLEPRCIIASWDPDEDRPVIRVTSQLPHSFRADLSTMLQMPESDIRVVTPPLGGGFGFKFPGQPEEPLTALAAKVLRRPVRWAETRAESMLVGAREYCGSRPVEWCNSGPAS